MSFEAYRAQKRQRAGKCSTCGAESAGRVVVTLQGRQENPEKGKGETNRYSYPSIASVSGTYCEAHAVEVFEAARQFVSAKDAGR